MKTEGQLCTDISPQGQGGEWRHDFSNTSTSGTLLHICTSSCLCSHHYTVLFTRPSDGGSTSYWLFPPDRREGKTHSANTATPHDHTLTDWRAIQEEARGTGHTPKILTHAANGLLQRRPWVHSPNHRKGCHVLMHWLAPNIIIQLNLCLPAGWQRVTLFTGPGLINIEPAWPLGHGHCYAFYWGMWLDPRLAQFPPFSVSANPTPSSWVPPNLTCVGEIPEQEGAARAPTFRSRGCLLGGQKRKPSSACLSGHLHLHKDQRNREEITCDKTTVLDTKPPWFSPWQGPQTTGT